MVVVIERINPFVELLDAFDPARPVPNMVKRPGQPLEAAKAVLFLASEDSSFVYGANLFVDGGVSAMDLS